LTCASLSLRSEPTVFGDKLPNLNPISSANDHQKITFTVPYPFFLEFLYTHSIASDIFVDNVHIELSLWDTAGQEEFDRLRSLSYDDTHTIMLCFSVDSKDSLENVESKWVGEIAENCHGVKLVLVALKCDLREREGDEEEAVDKGGREKVMVDYKQGLEVAKRIQALRYLGMLIIWIEEGGC